jgi:transposase InsO family protein
MPNTRRGRFGHEVLGHAFMHTVIDDHSRVAYAEIHGDETATTAIAVLHRAVSWFSVRGAGVEEVISDNASYCRSRAWRQACQELGVKHRRTRPYRPQTNGKI